jgi:hypothetical protein
MGLLIARLQSTTFVTVRNELGALFSMCYGDFCAFSSIDQSRPVWGLVAGLYLSSEIGSCPNSGNEAIAQASIEPPPGLVAVASIEALLLRH